MSGGRTDTHGAAHVCRSHATHVGSTFREHSCVHVGDQCCPPHPRARVGQHEPGPAGALLTALPTMHAGQVPPEDDEYEYSEYSVEEYQDPEAPWDGDGEKGGWAQRDWGRGRQSPSLLTSLTSISPGPLLASTGRGLLYCLHPALVSSGCGRWYGGLSPLCLWWLRRECQPFWDP